MNMHGICLYSCTACTRVSLSSEPPTTPADEYPPNRTLESDQSEDYFSAVKLYAAKVRGKGGGGDVKPDRKGSQAQASRGERRKAWPTSVSGGGGIEE